MELKTISNSKEMKLRNPNIIGSPIVNDFFSVNKVEYDMNLYQEYLKFSELKTYKEWENNFYFERVLKLILNKYDENIKFVLKLMLNNCKIGEQIKLVYTKSLVCMICRESIDGNMIKELKIENNINGIEYGIHHRYCHLVNCYAEYLQIKTIIKNLHFIKIMPKNSTLLLNSFITMETLIKNLIT